MATSNWKNKLGVYLMAAVGIGLVFFVYARYKNAKSTALKSVGKIFELSRSGSVTEAASRDLLSPSALTFLQSLGNKTGVFDSYKEGKAYCPPGGSPVSVDVNVTQGAQTFPITLTMDGEWCMYGTMNPPVINQ